MDLKGNFLMGKTIAKEWKKEKQLEEKDVDKEPDEIGKKSIRRFKTILEELGFSKEEIKWYKSISDKEGSGPFIFIQPETPRLMKGLFDIFEKKHIDITSKERDKIIEYLMALLPDVRTVEDVKLIHQEYEKIREYSVEEEENFRCGMCPSFDFGALTDINDDHKARVVEIVRHYYVKDINIRMTDFFNKNIFTCMENKALLPKRLRQELYKHLYSLIKDWTQEFDFIMEKAAAVRIAERYQDVYGTILFKNISKEVRADYCRTGKTENIDLETFCQDMEWIGESELYRALQMIFREDKNSKKDLENVTGNETEQIIRTEEECYRKCLEQVMKISKHSLEKTSKRDFEYIINYAMEELELICEKMRKPQLEKFYLNDLGRDGSDFEILDRVREYTRKNRTIVDNQLYYGK